MKKFLPLSRGIKTRRENKLPDIKRPDVGRRSQSIDLPLLLLLAPLPLLLLLLRWQVSSATAAVAVSVHSSSSACQSRWFCGISGTNLASTLTRERSNRPPMRDSHIARFYTFLISSFSTRYKR